MTTPDTTPSSRPSPGGYSRSRKCYGTEDNSLLQRKGWGLGPVRAPTETTYLSPPVTWPVRGLGVISNVGGGSEGTLWLWCHNTSQDLVAGPSTLRWTRVPPWGWLSVWWTVVPVPRLNPGGRTSCGHRCRVHPRSPMVVFLTGPTVGTSDTLYYLLTLKVGVHNPPK